MKAMLLKEKVRSCEIEITHPKIKKRKLFLLVYWDPTEIWVDLEGLPKSAFFCACCDGQEMIKAVVGAGKGEERHFLNIEWVINEWGGPKELVDALEKRKQMTLEELPQLKEKYA